MNRSEPMAQDCAGADDLAVPPLDLGPDLRLRSHTEGSLAGQGARRWGGPPVPDHVPAALGTLELFLLDPADGGLLALYREPYGITSCGLGGELNCAYEARFYDGAGRMAWALPLNRLLSRPDELEIQDIRLAGGILYFNEACQSYSSGADGMCSSLVAVDPRARRVRWRTPPLTSNGRFAVRGCYVIAGYGFTGEADAVHLVDRASGRVHETHGVASAPQGYHFVAPDRLDVRLYAGGVRRFRLRDIETPRGALVPMDPDDPAFGGAGYGGNGYGGHGHGGYGGHGYGGRGYRGSNRRP
jgi:hypothetical protein